MDCATKRPGKGNAKWSGKIQSKQKNPRSEGFLFSFTPQGKSMRKKPCVSHECLRGSCTQIFMVKQIP